MERWKLIGYVIPATTASLLAVALWMGNAPLAFGVLAGAIGVMLLYSEWLRGRGEVLSDERTLRIEEMASKRTLQVLILVIAFLVVGLSIFSERDPGLRSAYYLSLGLMVLISALKVSLKRHYSRVM
ncbi:DUF2178 domain-containing protein [Thermococcus pacificus]|uniref:DUF2178 domain-containing protein n=1 Tax=Thermococcus pacificus TaxID=71998 RepID=A0A218P521_9EURY|nr:DUF2178 domain-containing protein [Thermococcus pacificus]ASJ05867.1 hypothetical protein A3L08_00215 [Thermococcus pacificus]